MGEHQGRRKPKINCVPNRSHEGRLRTKQTRYRNASKYTQISKTPEKSEKSEPHTDPVEVDRSHSGLIEGKHLALTREYIMLAIRGFKLVLIVPQALDIETAPVPRLEYGLDRALFK